jgi:hypothetical protein
MRYTGRCHAHSVEREVLDRPPRTPHRRRHHELRPRNAAPDGSARRRAVSPNPTTTSRREHRAPERRRGRGETAPSGASRRAYALRASFPAGVTTWRQSPVSLSTIRQLSSIVFPGTLERCAVGGLQVLSRSRACLSSSACRLHRPLRTRPRRRAGRAARRRGPARLQLAVGIESRTTLYCPGCVRREFD